MKYNIGWEYFGLSLNTGKRHQFWMKVIDFQDGKYLFQYNYNYPDGADMTGGADPDTMDRYDLKPLPKFQTKLYKVLA